MMNSWGYKQPRWQDETRDRIDLGWQCPECFGVNITSEPRQPHDPHHYQCQECGCQWSRSV
jgi:hypothetical protein